MKKSSLLLQILGLTILIVAMCNKTVLNKANHQADMILFSTCNITFLTEKWLNYSHRLTDSHYPIYPNLEMLSCLKIK